MVRRSRRRSRRQRGGDSTELTEAQTTYDVAKAALISTLYNEVDSSTDDNIKSTLRTRLTELGAPEERPLPTPVVEEQDGEPQDDVSQDGEPPVVEVQSGEPQAGEPPVVEVQSGESQDGVTPPGGGGRRRRKSRRSRRPIKSRRSRRSRRH